MTSSGLRRFLGDRRVWLAAGIAAAILVLAAAGWALYGMRMVQVRTGEIIVGTDGRLISDNTTTITVPASEAGKYFVTKRTVDATSEFERLFAEAQTDIEANDLVSAQKALSTALLYRPGDATASRQLSEISAGRTPKPVSPGQGTVPPSGDATRPPVPPGPGTQVPVPPPQLSTWVPNVIAGYTAAPIQVDELTVSREYVPKDTSRVGSLVIVVQQFTTSAAARSALDRAIRPAYPQDVASPKVNGRSAYFGTDGRRFAVLAFDAEGTLVALEMGAAKGAPVTLRSDLLGVAAGLGK